jgi:hypothetical protein
MTATSNGETCRGREKTQNGIETGRLARSRRWVVGRGREKTQNGIETWRWGRCRSGGRRVEAGRKPRTGLKLGGDDIVADPHEKSRQGENPERD